MGIVNGEFAHRGALERREMSTWPHLLSQIVRKGAEIRSRADPGAKANRLTVAIIELQLFDLDLLGLEFHGLSFSRQSMSGNAGNFLGGKRRRILCNLADEFGRSLLHLLQR